MTIREDPGLWRLFRPTAQAEKHTSAAALTAFVLGISALLAAGFSVMFAVAAGPAVTSLVASLVGIARTSRPEIAGSALALAGLAMSVAALALLGRRSLNVDTAFGNQLLPWRGDPFADLNARMPAP